MCLNSLDTTVNLIMKSVHCTSVQALISLVVTLSVPVTLSAEIDSSCVVSVLNRTVQPNSDGTWVVPNIPATLGQVRARASCIRDGITKSGQSDYFTLPVDGAVTLPPISLSNPQPVPASLEITAPTLNLTSEVPAVQLAVTATFPDGSEADRTSADSGTSYTSSNTLIASVNADGLVSAQSSGVVLVSAINEGVLGVAWLLSVLSADTDGDGIPDDVELSLGLDPNDPIDALEDSDGDGLSNGEEFQIGTDLQDPDSDDDGISDGEEVVSGGDGWVTNPLLADTDGDGLWDGLEIATESDPTDPASFNLALAMSSMEISPVEFILVFNAILGEASQQLAVTGNLIDGNTIDLTSTTRGTSYLSSDLGICSFGATDGQVFAGQAGRCTVTASNSGFTANADAVVYTFIPRGVSFLDLPGYGNNLDVAGNYVYVAVGPAGLAVIDVSDRNQPLLVTTLPLSGNANDVRVSSSVAYVAGGSAGLHIVDVSNPTAPYLLKTVDTPGEAIDVAFGGGTAAVADGVGGVQIIAVSDPANAALIGGSTTSGSASGIGFSDSIIVLSNFEGFVDVIDIADPSNPQIASTVDLGGLQAFDVAMNPPYAYIGTSDDLRVIDFSVPAAAAFTGAYGDNMWMLDVELGPVLDLGFTTQVRPDTPLPIFNAVSPAAPLFVDTLFFGAASGVNGDALGIAADSSFVYITASFGYEVTSKPGSSGLTRFYIGQYLVLEDEFDIEPTVDIDSPSTGDTFAVGESLLIRADATDDVAVAAVEFLVDGVGRFVDVTAPYEFSFVAPFTDSLTLQAKAIDFGNNVGFSEEVVVSIISDPGTTAVGRVIDDSAIPVGGAQVSCHGQTAVSNADGSFSVSGLSTLTDQIQCRAFQPGTSLVSTLVSALSVRGGITEMGDLVLSSKDPLYPAEKFWTGSTGGANVVHLADLNGDGSDDAVATIPGDSYKISILMGKGDSTFEAYQNFPVGRGAWYVTTGDFNGDNALDIVTSNYSADAISVVLSDSSNAGTYLSAVDYPAGDYPNGIAVGDLDNDGALDIVTANGNSDDVSVFMGNGDGTFAPQLRFAAGDRPLDTGVADLNKDGWLDVVVANSNSGDFSVFLALGDGSFGPVTHYPVGSGVDSLQISDLNDDGHLDLAGTMYSANSVAAVLGFGDGTFGVAQVFPTGNRGGPHYIDSADITLNGTADLIVANIREDDISLLEGAGDGSFGEAQRITVGWPPGATRAADLDKDGRPEVATAVCRGISVLRNRQGKLEAPEIYVAGEYPYSVEAGDLNGDGYPDIVAPNAWAVKDGILSDEVVSVLLNLGDGTFGPMRAFSADFQASSVSIADLNGDGISDLAVVNNAWGTSSDDISVLMGVGDGTFLPQQRYPVGELPSLVKAVDFDDDGKLDLLVSNGDDEFGSGGSGDVSILLGLGDGTFEPQIRVPVGSGPVSFDTPDLNSDGRLDLVSANIQAGTVSVLLTNEDFSLTKVAEIPVGDPTRDDPVDGETGPSSVVAADINEDGAADLVTTNYFSTDISILLGIGDGTFQAESRLSIDHADWPDSLRIADLNRDGHLDLAMVHGCDEVSVYLGHGDGTFDEPRMFVAGAFPYGMTVSDVNQDGYLDIVTIRSPGAKPEGVSVLLYR